MFTDQEKEHILSCKRKIKELVHIKGIQPMEGAIIAGGIFTSLLRGETYKDIDVFVLDNFQYVMTKNSIIQNNSMYLTKDNPNLVSVFLDDSQAVNTIFTKYTKREEVVNNFDFVHCCVSYDFDRLYISRKAYDCIMSRKLVANNKVIVNDYRRQKFLKRGFNEDIGI